MRDLKRNQSLIYVSLRNVKSNTDEWGNSTDVTTYGEPIPMKITLSSDKGEASAQAFGTDVQYDREMSTHDMNCPIDEFSHLWIDGRPKSETHNYEVSAVSRSLNCIRFAIRRVNVS